MKLNKFMCVLCVFIVNNVTPIFSEEDDYKDILDKVPKWVNLNLTEENIYVLKQKLENEKKLIDDVAYRGDKQKDYRITLRDMNILTRKHYTEMINHVGYNIFPLLVATDVDLDKRISGGSAEFILFLRNGSILTSKPIPPSYQINKDLSHISIGIFSIISPFFNNPTSPMWHDKLREYQKYIQNTLEYFMTPSTAAFSVSVFCDDNLSNEEQKEMLTISNDYINNCFKHQRVDHMAFQEYSKNVRRLIHKAIKCSAKVQAMASIRQLKIWKEALGDEWDDLYVLIPVIWPVARKNPRRQIIEIFMSEERRITNIIMAEGAKSIHEAREILGRVVADRTMSELIFSHNTERNIQQNVALSTKTDMVAPSTEELLMGVNVSSIRLSDPYDEPNDIRFDYFHQYPLY